MPGFVGFAARSGVHQLQVSPGQVYREDWVENSLLCAPELTRRMASKAEKRARELGVTLINNLRIELRQAMLDRTPPEACRKCYEFNRHRPDIMISLDAVPEK
ncbi:MAG: hypothetical protein JSU96_12845 [Acidobacteriota bacterium]|nr:MAG: hypothetical protein JSU96_12845 [Acidobacteriota bacterium]